jgi:O-antigen/teichoic acid export membrane protein
VGYLKDTVRGVSWVGGFRVTNRGVTFLKTAILARLLTPAQFGVFGIATLALAFLEVLTETGINIFLIQDEGKLEEYLDTAWLVSIIRGTLISLVMLLLSAPIAGFFNSPDSYKVLLLISFVPFARGFINPSVVKFQKELEFNKEFWFRSAILLVETLVAVTLSYLTRSVFALIWGMYAGVAVELILSFAIIKPRPKLAFEVVKVKRVIDRGKWVTMAAVFNYLFQNGDNMTVGKLLGEAPLGIYSVAYKISSLPISEISDVFVKVTFPVYVKIAGDIKRLRTAFAKTMIGSSVLVIIAGLLIYFMAKPIVLVVLGESWLAAVPVVKILSIFGVIKGIAGPSLSLFLAVGKQEYATYTTLLGIVALAIPIIPLTLKYGLTGTGISVIISSVVTLPLIGYYVYRILWK